MHTKRSALIGIAGAAALAAGCGGGAAQKPDEPAPTPAARMAVVPNLVGVEQSRAHRLAGRRGFTMHWMGYVGRLANGHTNVGCVKVHSQSPVAGTRRTPGASIAVLEIACRTPTGKWHDAAGVEN